MKKHLLKNISASQKDSRRKKMKQNSISAFSHFIEMEILLQTDRASNTGFPLLPNPS